MEFDFDLCGGIYPKGARHNGYTDDRELLMDILKHGADVEVVVPDTLLQRVRDEIARMTTRYSL